MKILPRRWVVERTFGWMTRCRHLARGSERRLDVSRRLHKRQPRALKRPLVRSQTYLRRRFQRPSGASDEPWVATCNG
jgi:transposase